MRLNVLLFAIAMIKSPAGACLAARRALSQPSFKLPALRIRLSRQS